MAEKVKKRKKVKEPFWKKAGPELRSVSEHVGKFLDNLKVNDIIDLALIGSLAYLSYDVFKTVRKEKQKVLVGYTKQVRIDALLGGGEPVYKEQEVEVVEHHLPTALIGPIGYKLATTMGGTPPVSQISGLTILAALGLVSIIGLSPEEKAAISKVSPFWPKAPEWWPWKMYVPF